MQYFHELVEKNANDHANRVAMQFENNTAYTYDAFNAQANRIAHYLQTQGINSGDIVAVKLPRGEAHPLLFTALSKLGATYLPLDAACPTNRFSAILNDAKPALVITDDNIAIDQKSLNYLDTAVQHTISKQSPENLSPVTGDLNAYLIYTSGTTATPKGVPIRHAGLMYWDKTLKNHIGINEERKILGIISPGFDASLWEYLMALGAGASLHLVSEDRRSDIDALVTFINDHKITDATLIPSQINLFTDVQLKSLEPHIKTIFSTGEACTKEILERFAAAGLDGRLNDAYGPTEICFGLSAKYIFLKDLVNNQIPIGKPYDIPEGNINEKIFVDILDKDLKKVKPGEPGILYIHSPYMCNGYLNRPEETAEAFITIRKDLNDGRGPREIKLYKTNDLFTYNTYNGQKQLFFLGRASDISHVKINGVLTNPQETETSIRALDVIQEARVVIRDNPINKQQELLAFVVPKQGKQIDMNQLRADLSKKLLPTAIPIAFIQKNSLPLTHNGKLDKEALKVEAQAYRANHESKTNILPRTLLEEEIYTICKKIFGFDSFSVDANFLQLGISSTNMQQLLGRIRADYHISGLSIHSLKTEANIAFDAVTPSNKLPINIINLAKFVRNLLNQKNPLLPNLVAGTDNNKPNIFLLPPIMGISSGTYDAFAATLQEKTALNVYTLDCPGFFDPKLIHTDLDEIAENFAKAIIKQQPTGDIQLFGWSFGGIVAYAVAERLEAKGRTVAYLGLGDSPAPSAYCALTDTPFANEILKVAGLLCDTLNIQKNLPPHESLAKLDKTEQITALFDHMIAAETAQDNKSLLRMTQSNMLSSLKYIPKPLKATLYLYPCRETQPTFDNKKDLDWSKSLTTNGLVMIPPNALSHFELIQQPKYLVEEMENHIKGQQAAPPTNDLMKMFQPITAMFKRGQIEENHFRMLIQLAIATCADLDTNQNAQITEMFPNGGITEKHLELLIRTLITATSNPNPNQGAQERVDKIVTVAYPRPGQSGTTSPNTNPHGHKPG